MILSSSVLIAANTTIAPDLLRLLAVIARYEEYFHRGRQDFYLNCVLVVGPGSLGSEVADQRRPRPYMRVILVMLTCACGPRVHVASQRFRRMLEAMT